MLRLRRCLHWHQFSQAHLQLEMQPSYLWTLLLSDRHQKHAMNRRKELEVNRVPMHGRQTHHQDQRMKALSVTVDRVLWTHASCSAGPPWPHGQESLAVHKTSLNFTASMHLGGGSAVNPTLVTIEQWPLTPEIRFGCKSDGCMCSSRC